MIHDVRSDLGSEVKGDRLPDFNLEQDRPSHPVEGERNTEVERHKETARVHGRELSVNGSTELSTAQHNFIRITGSSRRVGRATGGSELDLPSVHTLAFISYPVSRA